MDSKAVYMPQDIEQQFNKQAAEAGYTSQRKDSKNSRWAYFKKLMVLGQNNKELLFI